MRDAVYGMWAAVDNLPAGPPAQSETGNELLANAKRHDDSGVGDVDRIEHLLKRRVAQDVSHRDVGQAGACVTSTIEECDELVDLAISVGLEKSVSVLSEHVEPFLLHA